MTTRIKPLTKEDRFLIKVDSKLADIIKASDPMKIRNNHSSGFKVLIRSIIGQQVSLAAARAIYKKFILLFPGKKFPSYKDVQSIDDQELRQAGLSTMKASYIKNLAQHIAEGKINFRKMRRLSDEEVITALVDVKGIGQWTAEMFLIFHLRRPDIFSATDLGLLKSLQKAYGLKSLPAPHQAQKIAQKWSPCRSLATRYLWANA